jgi:chaperonin cofactor prefoldin
MLGQLQMKMIDIQTSLKKSTTQIDGLKREIQRSKLTDREINTLNAETRMYTSVGRMYEIIPFEMP